ncbi:hypothetical protein CR155_08110 [Pollutimonas nitritireducens]|uniref:Lipoprotein n=1 Tax=Pollutimonas nitritireducens TaxID=2045209 RepID=A0A2N4UGD2_9BURK|nr:hypothetical protein [Pollutimonas nitritireducens]PLC54082.1 hypothetical protein CR155_08110 [Pollutimonas nitritireducens]
MKRCSVAWVILATALVLSGCMGSQAQHGTSQPRDEEMSFDQLGQTDFNRTVTIAMRDNLDSLSRLLEKLYRRNPGEWRKTGAQSLAEAVREGREAIRSGQGPADLAALHDIEILSLALDPAYQGDRAGTLIFGLSDMVVRAHNGKTRFYATDVLNAQHVYNAARNVEIAAWLLATRRDAGGKPLLLANEITDAISNLSFEREFGQLVGRLDLVANLLDENLRRVGINYMQGLLFFNFLPVR